MEPPLGPRSDEVGKAEQKRAKQKEKKAKKRKAEEKKSPSPTPKSSPTPTPEVTPKKARGSLKSIWMASMIASLE